VAVGQTLRSPMRGARTLAERLRARNPGGVWGDSTFQLKDNVITLDKLLKNDGHLTPENDAQLCAL